MAVVSLTSATAGQVLTASFYNNNNNAIINQINGNLDSNNLANLSVTSGKLVTGAVTGTKIAMGSDAQGDVLIRGAANYERLGAGTNGQFLMTQGAGANPKWDYGNYVQSVTTSSGAVATGNTAMPYDDTQPLAAEGTAFSNVLDTTITPKYSTSKLRVTLVANLTNSGGAKQIMALYRDTGDAVTACVMEVATANQEQVMVIQYEVTSGSTSSTTFKMRAGTNGGDTMTLNGSAGARKLGGYLISRMTIEEVRV